MNRMQAAGRVLLAVLLLTLGGAALAQNADKKASREREALRRAQQQVQKANQDLAALQARFDAAEKERAELAGQIEKSQTQARSEAARGQKLQKELQALGTERETLQKTAGEQDAQIKTQSERIAKLERELAQALERDRQLDAQGNLLRQQNAACEDRGARLYSTGRELIDECRVFGTEHLEPFTGIGKTRVENRLEAFRDRLDAARSPAQNASR